MEPSGEVREPPQGAHTLERVTRDDVAPATAYVPAGQVTRPEHKGEVSRKAVPNVPAGHCVQVDAPLKELYEPGEQARQALMFVAPVVEL